MSAHELAVDGRAPGVSLVAAIVGIDGCGKTSTFGDALAQLATTVPLAGVGSEVWSGGPGERLRGRTDIPRSGIARVVGAAAKGLRRPTLYKDLKLLEFVERTHVRDHLLAHDRPGVVLTDGDPLVNVAAWAVARYSRTELTGDDDRLEDLLHYLAGDRRIPRQQLPYYLRHGWQVALLNSLHLADFGFPDVVLLLEIDPAVAMERIAARGRPLQVHENVAFLGELAAAYRRVCGLLEDRLAVPVVRVPVGALSHEAVVETVVGAVRERLASDGDHLSEGTALPEIVEVVATTISGSFADQRNVRRIAPTFRTVTHRPVRVHPATTHAAATRLAHDIVARGGRTIVSAGGAGTFNAVLEGCHLAGAVPPDLRLAFLRKGSADLIGKVLHVPDDLAAAAAGIMAGVEADRCVDAAILGVEATEPDGSVETRHLVGFGGLGIFGEVPRFTESRFVKLYKGLLGTMFGDLGPFYVGLALATAWWWVQRLRRRVPELVAAVDGRSWPPERWAAVIVLNGDLGKDFPLGKGLSLASDGFRVVALHYRGIGMLLRQVAACRSAAVLDRPDDFAAVVVEGRRLSAAPAHASHRFMVNVDGLRLLTRGEVTVEVTGRVRLVDAGPEGDPWTRSSTS